MSGPPDLAELERLRLKLEDLQLAQEAAEQGRADLLAAAAAVEEELEDLALELEALRSSAAADGDLLARLGAARS